MTGPRHVPDGARAEVKDALAEGKRRNGRDRPRVAVGARALLGLQRDAGNAAVNALMAARMRWPGPAAVSDIDAALVEVRGDDPAVDIVEKGLKAAKATGVPVELEGPKPPASALAVTRTGFGPHAVPAKKPVPPPKPVPAVSPLGKAGAKGAKGGSAGGAPAPTTLGAAGAAAGPAIEAAPAAADQLLEPPVAPTEVRPEDDPAFTAVTGNVKAVAKAKKDHPPAQSKAKEAQDAALPPSGDLAGQAKAAKVDSMDAQQAGSFDKKAFIASVKEAIEAKSPKTLKEADDYAESGKAGEVKGDIKGLVGEGKSGQTKDIETATDAAPDESKAVPKPVTPMAAEQPGASIGVAAAGAAPKPAPPEQLNLAAGKQQANQEMADGQVTEPQLAESNEPEFHQALADKNAAASHADTAPGEFRQQEQQVIQQGKTEAGAQTAAGVDGMHATKATALAKLVSDKGKTKSKDEAKRAEVTTKIQSIFTATETDVKKILDGIDPKVEAAFDQGEAAARQKFESYVDAKMSAYKEDRYSGWLGGLRWAKDKLLGMPDKVNEFYEAGRELYLKQMDTVISHVADIVGSDLNAAKARIASGRTEITTYVKSLPVDLQKVGAEASQEIGDRFEQLENDVNAKQDSVVDTLATKYTEARKGLDDRIEELQAENKGLVDKAIGAIKAVVNTIRELAAMLMNVLARVAGVVGDIIAHPVRFLGSLIDGVKGGILKFKDSILDHLRNGLMSWLFGALAESGVELPDSFDVKGVIKLLASIFGLTWRNIRNRLVKQIGEKAMSAVEKGVEIFQIISSQGIGGLWQMLVDKLGDIKEMILEQVKDFVVTKIITAGITWLIGLLNPVAAFVKACKLIYEIVMFFVNNAGRIMAFVNTIIDSVADMVRGNVGAVVDKVNDVLGKMVPILIGFLASVIGLGGVGEKVRQIVHTLQKPIGKAVDFIVKTGLKLAGPIIRGIKGVSTRVKAKVAAGKAWVKGKVAAGKAKLADIASLLPGAFGFRAGGESHRIWIEKAATPRVMVASNPAPGGVVLDHYAAIAATIPAPANQPGKAQVPLSLRVQTARGRLLKLDGLLAHAAANPNDQTNRPRIAKAQEQLGESMGPIFDAVHKHQMKLAGQVPKYVTPGGKTSQGSVRCVATLRVDCGPGERPYPTGADGTPVGTAPGFGGRVGRGGAVAHGIDPKESVKSGQVGGFVIEAEPNAKQEENAPEVPHIEKAAQFVTRATGDAAPNTHAEARLFDQLSEMISKDPAWKSRIRTVEIQISHSPCPACADVLIGLHKMLAHSGVRLTILQWGKRYSTGAYPTNPKDIPRLAGAYNVVHGP